MLNKRANVVPISADKKVCPWCEGDSKAPLMINGTCTDCAMDDELNELLEAAVHRAQFLGLEYERVEANFEAAWDVAGLDLGLDELDAPS